MNDDVVTKVEGKAAALPKMETAGEASERRLALLLEALEGRLSSPEYREVLRILVPATVESPARKTGKG